MAEQLGKLAEVSDIRTWCRSFPGLPEHLIERPNIIGELQDAFSRGTELVAVEGEDGKGKTTLLAQFALLHPIHTIALFARPTSPHSYDPLYLLTDLCEQLHWLVYGMPRFDTGSLPNDGEYRMLLTLLEGRALRTRQPYYFLVDGLEEISEEGIAARDQLLELVPFGRQPFRFLYAGYPGALGRLPHRVRSGTAHAQFLVTRFTLDETERYLAGLDLSEGDVRQLFDLTRGLPGHLAIVRRVLRDGLPVERLMADLPPELSGLFAYEWEALAAARSDDAELLQDMLALMAHDRGHHTLGSIARLTNAPVERVETLLKPLGFVRIGPIQEATYAGDPIQAIESSVVDTNLGSSEASSSDREVAFVPEAFRAYAARRLASRQQWARERVVADLAKHPMSVDTLTRLPTSLEEMGRYDDLVQYLTPDYFSALVEHHRPLGHALAAADKGIRASNATRRDVDLAQFSLIRSLLLELGRAGVGTEEVEARIALGDEDRALALALSAPLVEDRLELLATIAKERRLRGAPSRSDIHGQLEQLAAQVDPDVLGKRARTIGINLLFSLPDVALHFMERADAQHDDADDADSVAKRRELEEDPDLRDWFDSAGEAIGEGRTEVLEAFEALRTTLSNGSNGQLTAVLSVLYGGRSAEDVLDTLDDLSRSRDQIFVLRQWLRRNAARPDAAQVVDEVLDRILLHSGEEMPKADVFRDIAAPLPLLDNFAQVARLVGRIDTLADDIKRRGPSRDFVRLQLRLARAECRYDPDRATSRLMEVWYFAVVLDDLVERAACVAYVSAALGPIAKIARSTGQQSPLDEQAVAEIETTLDTLIGQILATCADQYHATRGVIRALAPQQPIRALAIASRLNTRNRRLAATLDALLLTIRNIRNDTVDAVVNALDRGLEILVGTVQGDIALLQIADTAATLAGTGEAHRRLPARLSDAETGLVAWLLPYLERCDTIVGARRRCRALALWEAALRHLERTAEFRAEATIGSGATVEGLPHGPLTPARVAKLVPQTASRVDAAWDNIDPGWRKITLGFELAHLLSSDDPVRAQTFVSRAEEMRRYMCMPSESAATPHGICVSMAVRAYAGLLKQDLQTEVDLARLGRIIDTLPSWAERASAWADVAVRCFLQRHDQLGRHIVVNHVHRLIELVGKQDAVLRRWVIAGAAPALYLAHPETAREWIRTVAEPYRASIYASIAHVLIAQSPPGDPYNHSTAIGRALSYPEVIDLCRLIEDIDHDGLLYHIVAWLADCIVAGRSTGKLSREQQRHVADRVRRAVELHLPDPRNIQHQGYKLITLAQVARMDPLENKRPELWKDLAAAAHEIPNASDRAFVLSHLAVTTPSLEDRKVWLSQADTAIAAIPARLNRMEDYAALANMVLKANWGEIGASQARNWLRKGMDTAAADPHDNTTYRAQRRLIDIAYQLDEALARELAAKIDDDPARLAHRVRTLELKKKLSDATNASDTSANHTAHLLQVGSRETNSPQRLHTLIDACELNLAALHAGRIPAVHIEYLRDPLIAAAHLSLSEAAPIYAWALENAIHRLGGAAQQARATLRPMFEAITQVAELAPRLEEDATTRAERIARAMIQSLPADSGRWLSIRIGPGEREEAERVLREWCEAHPSPYIKLSDRYFGPEELRWLRLFTEAMPHGCRIRVLTSRKGLLDGHVAQPWAQTYKLHWRQKIGDMEPPPAEIVILGTARDGQAPFHDRRLIVGGAGLKIGVSFNALGGTTDTTISELTPSEVEDTERDLDKWAQGGAWEYKGERLLRTVVQLDDPDA